jgi:signal recognition particle subunit SRP19
MGKKKGGVRVKQVGPKQPAMPLNPMEGLAIPPEEMIHLPPKPDTNISHVWPMSETFSLNFKQFSAIYPNYLDATKSVKRGRRISAEQAVAHPSVQDIGEALQVSGSFNVSSLPHGFHYSYALDA